MTTITHDDIVKLAQLSSLNLTGEEIVSLQSDIASILGYVEQLDTLDTSDVVPLYQVTGLENVMRADEVEHGSVSREQLLALAPDKKDNQIKVPKVL